MTPNDNVPLFNGGAEEDLQKFKKFINDLDYKSKDKKNIIGGIQIFKFKENKILTNTFNKSVNSLSDFYIFLNSTKSYLEIIKNSNDMASALYNFPRYLFAEKDVFLKIYNKINREKLIKIYKNISKAEFLVRQNSELYLVVGLRFFLNLKKIITS